MTWQYPQKSSLSVSLTYNTPEYINESPPLPHDLPVPKLPWLRYLTKLYTVYSQYKSPFFHTVVTVVLLLTVQWPCSS